MYPFRCPECLGQNGVDVGPALFFPDGIRKQQRFVTLKHPCLVEVNNPVYELCNKSPSSVLRVGEHHRHQEVGAVVVVTATWHNLGHRSHFPRLRSEVEELCGPPLIRVMLHLKSLKVLCGQRTFEGVCYGLVDRLHLADVILGKVVSVVKLVDREHR